MKYLFIILLFIGCGDDPKKPVTGNNGNTSTNKPVDTVVINKPTEPAPLSIWVDNRAIGMVMLANYTGWTGTDNYMNEDFTAVAENCIAVMKDIDAQGLIVWDPEGTKYPRAYSYYGDPKLTPEKVDAFFSTIKAAGFRVGVCLRPDVMIMTYNPPDAANWAGMKTPDHYVTQYPLYDLIMKVEYARLRWGCTLFYIDSNVGEGMQPGAKNTIGMGNLMPASIFAELNRLYPDCLFIPEHSDNTYFPYSLPYYPKGHGLPTTGRYVIDCGDTPEGVGNLKKAINDGHILLGRVWYQAPELDKIKKAYK